MSAQPPPPEGKPPPPEGKPPPPRTAPTMKGTCHKCAASVNRKSEKREDRIAECSVCDTRWHTYDCGRRYAQCNMEHFFDMTQCPKCNHHCKCAKGPVSCHTAENREKSKEKRQKQMPAEAGTQRSVSMETGPDEGKKNLVNRLGAQLMTMELASGELQRKLSESEVQCERLLVENKELKNKVYTYEAFITAHASQMQARPATEQRFEQIFSTQPHADNSMVIEDRRTWPTLIQSDDSFPSMSLAYPQVPTSIPSVGACEPSVFSFGSADALARDAKPFEDTSMLVVDPQLTLDSQFQCFQTVRPLEPSAPLTEINVFANPITDDTNLQRVFEVHHYSALDFQPQLSHLQSLPSSILPSSQILR